MQWNQHASQERLVFLLERKREPVDDRTKDLEQLGDTIVPLRLVDELEEHVVDGPSNERSQVEEFPVDPMQSSLEEVTLARILTVE